MFHLFRSASYGKKYDAIATAATVSSPIGEGCGNQD
jgi:hypothetical protein